MNTESTNPAAPTGKQRITRILSLVTALLCVLAVFVGSRMVRRQQGFPLGDFSQADVVAAQQAYERSGDAEDLIYLLKVLCYRVEVQGEDSLADSIADYGTQLIDMAKSEEIDLEVLGESDDTLLELLKTIRSYGAK